MKNSFILTLALVLLSQVSAVRAAIVKTAAKPAPSVEQLSAVRAQVLELEAQLIQNLRGAGETKTQVARINKIIELQKKERALALERIQTLENTISELQSRKAILEERVSIQRAAIKSGVLDVYRSLREVPAMSLGWLEFERIESPRRRVLQTLVRGGLREVKSLKVDLADAEDLSNQILLEQQALAYMSQDLEEQQNVLALNRQIQLDLFQNRHVERVAQLESYRALKSSEGRVNKLMTQFNSRSEIDRQMETERLISRAMRHAPFAQLRGRLPNPVPGGKVVGQFGPSFDSSSQLQVFKKGIEIAAAPSTSVKAVFGGRVAYVGELPGFGRVTIVDHGEHFYTLMGGLGDQRIKLGEKVAQGDVIGMSDDSGKPVYFEVRARNIPVNPLQWVSL